MESVGGKRKIDDEIELAKQKAQAIAARLISDAAATGDPKRPRTCDFGPPPPPDYSSSFSASSQNTSSSYPPVSSYSSSKNGLPTSKKIQIPNGKVGVIIGRGGDMIKTLQLQSGARIQITRDNEADPCSVTRDVELMGTQDQINRAQQLIIDTIAETDAAPTANRSAPPPLQPGAQQFVIKVPNDKVALVIGKGGETIKTMQTNSGARIQVVPLHLPPGDTSTERNVYINGTQEQIDVAKDLVNEVISGNRLKVNTYTQPAYGAGAGWASQGQPPAQQPPTYGYTQAGTYAMPPPTYYAGYPPQAAGWDQQTNAAAPSQQQSTGYNTYGQPPPTSTPPNVGYNYGQMPPTAAYSYNQGYPQQPPSYGQDVTGQTQPPNSAYAPPATSSQSDGSAAGLTSQPGYGTPAVSGQPDATAQPPSAYATGYSQAAAPPGNGYSAYPSYSAAPPVQPAYGQTGYPQAGYGQQQDGQVANQASYPYYAQSGYPPAQAPSQASYYQGAYPTVPPPQALPQIQPQGTNGVPPPSAYGVERTDGDSTTVSGAAAAAEGSEKPQS